MFDRLKAIFGLGAPPIPAPVAAPLSLCVQPSIDKDVMDALLRKPETMKRIWEITSPPKHDGIRLSPRVVNLNDETNFNGLFL